MLKSLRLRYFFTHLLISLLIALGGLCLVFLVWYQPPFAKAVGVGHIVIMLLIIDVILGPLLTFIITKENKKSLKFDLAVIALLQLSALSYGLYTVSLGRPVWVAFDHVRFELVQKHMVIRQPTETIVEQYQQDSWLYPQWVAARTAKDAKEQNEWLTLELQEAISPSMRPVLYQPIDENIERILQKKIPLQDLNKFNSLEEVKQILDKYPQADGYIPMKASELDMTVLVDSKNKQIVGVVDLRPW